MYTVRMGMNEEGFFSSTLPRVVYLVEKWAEERKTEASAMSGKPVPMPEPSRPVRSIKEALSHYGI